MLKEKYLGASPLAIRMVFGEPKRIYPKLKYYGDADRPGKFESDETWEYEGAIRPGSRHRSEISFHFEDGKVVAIRVF